MRVGALLLAGLLAAAPARADLLKGVVRDTTGAPVANADFDVFTPGGGLLAPDDNSDADGTYSIQLDAGVYDIVCEPPITTRLAPRVIRGVTVAAVTRLDWTLPASVRVIGRVRGPGNAPVARADLDFDRIDDGTRQPALGDLTSAFGTFAAYLEAGEYRVTVNPPDGVDLAPVRLAPVRLPTADTLTFLLPAAVHLNGTVRGAVGEPVSDARLSFERADTGERVPATGNTSAADGSVRAGVAAGVYWVRVVPPRSARLAPARLGPVDLNADQVLDVTLAAAVLVAGRVLDEEGLPLAGATWDVRDALGHDVPTPDDRTDAEGRFTLALAAGRYRMILRPPASAVLDSLVLDGVEVARDTTLEVRYGGPPLPEPPPSAIGLRPLRNPSHRTARVRLDLPASGQVRVEIFDVTGRRVRTALDGWLPAGGHELAWDGNRENGAPAHTSLFFVRAVQGNHVATTRLIVLPD